MLASTYQLINKYSYSNTNQWSSNENLPKIGYQNLGSGNDRYVSEVTWSNTTKYINAQGGDDYVDIQGWGNSVVYAGSGNDKVYAGSGADKLYGGSGNDQLHGAYGDDLLDGGTGDDWLYGFTDNDQLFGGEGNDRLDGGTGNDMLNGGEGNDKLFGGEGIDNMTGGGGADTFQFVIGTFDFVNYIDDFKVGEDKIQLQSKWGVILGQQWVSNGTVTIEQKADGQHVHMELAGTDFDLIVKTTDGSLLTVSDFV